MSPLTGRLRVRKFSTLSFTVAKRPGVKFPNGTSKSERTFLDFVVDGDSLLHLVKYDVISHLAVEWLDPEVTKAVNRLLLREAVDLPNNRRSLYICGECGGLGCGAVTLVVEENEGAVSWSDFGYENNYESEVHRSKLRDIGPFIFEKGPYTAAFREALRTLNKLKQKAHL